MKGLFSSQSNLIRLDLDQPEPAPLVSERGFPSTKVALFSNLK